MSAPLARNSTQEWRVLADAESALSSSLELDATLQAAADIAVPAIADWCEVELFARSGIAPQAAVAQVDVAVALSADARIVIPLRAATGTLGAMTIATAGAPNMKLATQLAARIARSLHNAARYSDRVRTVQTLQKAVLPGALPRLDGWRLAASYRPSVAEHEVGGDFYAVAETPTGFVLALGDVTGNGLDAAPPTVLARHTLMAAVRLTASPAAAVGFLNDILLDGSDADLLTAACADIRPTPRGARVRLTCAGHPLPLLARKGRPPVQVGEHQPMIGALDGYAWGETDVELALGDALVFYTDGVTDTPGRDERFGEQRLLAAIQDAPWDPEALVRHVGGAVDGWQYGSSTDDRTLIVLQLDSLPRPAAVEPLRLVAP